MFQLYRKRWYVKIFTAVLLFSAIQARMPKPLYAEEAGTMPDGDQTWTIGVSRFEGIGLEEDDLYMTMNIPGLLLEKIRICRDHYLTEEEKKGIRLNILAELAKARKKELHTLLTERDKLYFSQNRSKETLKTYKDRIQELEDQIEKIENFPLENIEVPDTKPIEIAEQEQRAGLLEETVFSPEYTAETNNLDMYIYGEIEEIEDYFFVHVYVWNSALGEHQMEIKDAASRTGINTLGERISSQIVRAVLGREWALLTIEVSPAEADIYVDEEYWGSGRVNDIIIEPGIHIIEIRSEGYKDRRIEFFVEETERNRLAVELEEAEVETVRIESFPWGADVYEGATWIGRTPVSVPAAGGLKRIFVRAPMFSTKKLTLSPDSPEDIFVRLSPFSLDREEYIETKRDEFYRAAGFFVLTFPLPFFLYSMSEDFASGYVIASQNNDTEGMSKNLQRSAVAYHSYLGSLVVVASMLINTVVNLAEYIIAGEG